MHHGDGTQELTYSSDNIMYISLHRYDGGKFFPKDPAGNYMYVGAEKSAGYNVNVAFENVRLAISNPQPRRNVSSHFRQK